MATYSALPATLNLVATVGNDFTLSLTVTENGSPWVSTGATLATDIIDSSGTVVATDFTTAASTGTVSLSLTDTQTGTLGVGVYSYRLSVTKSSLTRDWIAGTLSIVEAGQGGSSTSSASLSISNSAVSLSLTSLVAPLAENISVADAGGYYTGTTVEAVLAEIVPGYGVAVGAPGGVDDTALFDAAQALLPASGGLMVLRAGTYSLPAGFTFTKPVRLVGQGMGNPYGYNNSGYAGTYPPSYDARGLTTVVTDSATASGLTFSAGGWSLADLAIVNTRTTAPTAGGGVVVTDGGAFRMDRVAVVGFYDCVDIDNSGVWVMNGCLVMSPVRYGVRIRNTDVADEGDGAIIGCAILSGLRAPTAGVNWESGGGLKLAGTKINGHNATYYWGSGLRFNKSVTTSTSVGTVTGCSIENCQVGIDFNRQSSSGTYGKVAIVGNEIGVGRAGTSYGILCQSAGFDTIEISGNVFTSLTYGIILNYGTGVRVGPNTYTGIGTGGALTLGSTLTSAHVEPQYVYEDDVVVTDNTANTAHATVVYDYSRPTTGITSSDSTLYRLAVPASNAGTMEFAFTGNAVGVGAFALTGVRSYTRVSGSVTVATVGTDTSIGAATSDVSVTFDTAAVSGEVQVKVKLAGAATATDLRGVFALKVNGRLSVLRRGA